MNLLATPFFVFMPSYFIHVGRHYCCSPLPFSFAPFPIKCELKHWGNYIRSTIDLSPAHRVETSQAGNRRKRKIHGSAGENFAQFDSATGSKERKTSEMRGGRDERREARKVVCHQIFPFYHRFHRHHACSSFLPLCRLMLLLRTSYHPLSKFHLHLHVARIQRAAPSNGCRC